MTVRLSPEVHDALAHGKAVVALESTLITHGFPYRENLAIAQESEAEIRKSGAIPATVAVIDGHLHAGLDADQLARLAAPNPAHVKVSTRDLALCVARKATAGTTVAATMRIARQAGIAVFATGGIGGVHRNVADTWDISADLTELSRTNICVVCAGAKSLLDLPKTLEALETLGVPVIGYGTDDFPAFYTRSSGLRLDARVDTPEQAAQLIKAHQALALPSGLLLVQPVEEGLALPADEVETHIQAALREAAAKGITGKAVTPFMLRYLVQATNGRTIAPNKALIRANARLAGEVAVALAAVD